MVQQASLVGVSIALAPSLIHTLLFIVKRQQRAPLPMLLVFELLHTVWLDRWFIQQHQHIALSVTIQQTQWTSPHTLRRIGLFLLKLVDMQTHLS